MISGMHSQALRSLRVGVDVGGTFTDLVLVDSSNGEVQYLKLRSTTDPAEAVLQGTDQLLEQLSGSPLEVDYWAHGTTVATNILLERQGARTGLILTRGFRDMYELARQKRSDLYDLLVDKPVPLVPRDMAITAKERTSFEGEILVALEEGELDLAVERLVQQGANAIAICFLHSYANPAHEERAACIARSRFPDVFVTTSNRVLREFREYERTSTTVINAYVGPATSRYLDRIYSGLVERGMRLSPNVSRSDGGLMSMATASELPVSAIASGPAAGVAGAVHVAGLDALRDFLTMDIGGTSVDTCLVRNGQPQLAAQTSVGGLPVKVPMLDVHSVGAGGGSIAYVDEGLLKVGPRSAGASPGPASYGMGGVEPTVTDAHVVLGTLGGRRALGDRLLLSKAAAEEAIEAKVARPLGMSVVEAAHGIIAVMEANLVRALRRVSVEAGYDPRALSMVAYGGAGPLHAAAVSRELGIREALIPARPGILCAIGLLAEDVRSTFSRTHIFSADDPRAEPLLEELVGELEEVARSWLEGEGIPPERRSTELAVDLRFEGQNHELSVTVGTLPRGDLLARSVTGFLEAHLTQYGFADSAQPVEIVTVRVSARGQTPELVLPTDVREGVTGAKVETRDVYFPETGQRERTAVYQRDWLPKSIEGPAIIEQMDSTVVVPPGVTAHRRDSGNLVLQW
jgi:N-methylhydantoinase A